MHEADVRKWIIGHIADYLLIDEGDVLPDREFVALGLDSVDAILIGGALEEMLDAEIDATILLRTLCIDDLIAELRGLRLIAPDGVPRKRSPASGKPT